MLNKCVHCCLAMSVYVEIYELCWKKRLVFSNLLSRVIIYRVGSRDGWRGTDISTRCRDTEAQMFRNTAPKRDSKHPCHVTIAPFTPPATHSDRATWSHSFSMESWRLPGARTTVTVGDRMWACQAMRVKRQKFRIAQRYANEQRISQATTNRPLQCL